MRDRELSISDGSTRLGVSDSLGGLAILKCSNCACGGKPDGKRLVIDWKGIRCVQASCASWSFSLSCSLSPSAGVLMGPT